MKKNIYKEKSYKCYYKMLIFKKAKEYKVNLSQTLENSLKKVIKEIEVKNGEEKIKKL